MIELINQWFEQSSPFQGILACGVRYSEQAASSKTWSDGYSEMAVENALRGVADFFQVLQMNRIAPARLRWIYGNALLHCERRPDGTCLGVFTAKDTASIDLDALERYFAEFQAIARAIVV
jgi:hypothetical protein